MTSTEVIYAERKPVSRTVDGNPCTCDRCLCTMFGTAAARTAMTTNEKAQLATGSTYHEVDTGDNFMWSTPATDWVELT